MVQEVVNLNTSSSDCSTVLSDIVAEELENTEIVVIDAGDDTLLPGSVRAGNDNIGLSGRPTPSTPIHPAIANLLRRTNPYVSSFTSGVVAAEVVEVVVVAGK